MNEPNEKKDKPKSPVKKKGDETLARELRDLDLSGEEFNNLTEELKRRRKRLEGGGDSLFDTIYGED